MTIKLQCIAMHRTLSEVHKKIHWFDEMILRIILVLMHISPMDLYVMKHPASVIPSCITWLLFGTDFFKFLLFSKLSFAKQYFLLTKFTTVPLNFTANNCKQIIQFIFFNASCIISGKYCWKWLPLCEWVGPLVPFQRCLLFVIATSIK